MTHTNIHGASLDEFERAELARLIKSEAGALADKIDTVARMLCGIVDALTDNCTDNVNQHYSFTTEQVLAVLQLYGRALRADTPCTQTAFEWSLNRVSVDWLNKILVCNWAGMVIAIERDGYCHS